MHVHFKIRTTSTTGDAYEFTSQFFFDDTLSDQVFTLAPYNSKTGWRMRNADDNIYQSGGDQLLLNPIASADGYAATFPIGLDLSDMSVGAPDANTNPGGAFDADMNRMFAVTSGGNTQLAGGTQQIGSAAVLPARLVVRKGGQTIDASMQPLPNAASLVQIDPLVTAAVLYADLPSRFIAGAHSGVFGVTRWVVPALTILVLLTMIVIRPMGPLARLTGWRTESLHLSRRRLALAAIALVSSANAASIILLVHLLVNGATPKDAAPLLRAAVHMWVVNVLLFALWFWQLDGGGPLARPTCGSAERDFLFPQQTEEVFAAAGWRPLFLDYLYVSFTNATAFSPTDAMPLSRWAKMLMLAQSAISLALAVMVVARAVNILS